MTKIIVDVKENLKDENLYGKVCTNCNDHDLQLDERCGCANPHTVVYEKCVVCDELFEENIDSRLGCCSESCYEDMISDLCEKFLEEEELVALYMHFRNRDEALEKLKRLAKTSLFLYFQNILI